MTTITTKRYSTFIADHIQISPSFDFNRLHQTIENTLCAHLIPGGFNIHHPPRVGIKNISRCRPSYSIERRYRVLILSDGTPTDVCGSTRSSSFDVTMSSSSLKLWATRFPNIETFESDHYLIYTALQGPGVYVTHIYICHISWGLSYDYGENATMEISSDNKCGVTYEGKLSDYANLPEPLQRITADT